MINSDLQKQPFSELIKLRNFFQKKIRYHNGGDAEIKNGAYDKIYNAIDDLDEMILAKYSEETKTFTDYNYSNEVGN